MITNGEFVSRVVNGIHALDKDSHVSRRWILNIGRTKAESYTGCFENERNSDRDAA